MGWQPLRLSSTSVRLQPKRAAIAALSACLRNGHRSGTVEGPARLAPNGQEDVAVDLQPGDELHARPDSGLRPGKERSRRARQGKAAPGPGICTRAPRRTAARLAAALEAATRAAPSFDRLTLTGRSASRSEIRLPSRTANNDCLEQRAPFLRFVERARRTRLDDSDPLERRGHLRVARHVIHADEVLLRVAEQVLVKQECGIRMRRMPGDPDAI